MNHYFGQFDTTTVIYSSDTMKRPTEIGGKRSQRNGGVTKSAAGKVIFFATRGPGIR